MYGLLQTVSIWIIPVLILAVLIIGIVKKVPVYEEFVTGAKDGVKVGLDIIPYLVAIIVAVSMFRASGIMDFIAVKFASILSLLHVPSDVLPILFTRSLSGSATLGLLVDVIKSTGANSYATTLAAVMLGSSETTFYVLAVYFGSVGIKKYRHALAAGVLADIFGIIMAVLVCNLFFQFN